MQNQSTNDSGSETAEKLTQFVINRNRAVLLYPHINTRPEIRMDYVEERLDKLRSVNSGAALEGADVVIAIIWADLAQRVVDPVIKGVYFHPVVHEAWHEVKAWYEARGFGNHTGDQLMDEEVDTLLSIMEDRLKQSGDVFKPTTQELLWDEIVASAPPLQKAYDALVILESTLASAGDHPSRETVGIATIQMFWVAIAMGFKTSDSAIKVVESLEPFERFVALGESAGMDNEPTEALEALFRESLETLRKEAHVG